MEVLKVKVDLKSPTVERPLTGLKTMVLKQDGGYI
jgi:hypothetical protein